MIIEIGMETPITAMLPRLRRKNHNTATAKIPPKTRLDMRFEIELVIKADWSLTTVNFSWGWAASIWRSIRLTDSATRTVLAPLCRMTLMITVSSPL